MCCPWNAILAATLAPRSRSIAACVSLESAMVLSSSPTPYRKLSSLLRLTLRSTQNGTPSAVPSSLTRADLAKSFTTSVLVKAFPAPPSTRRSEVPVSAHIGAITSVVLPAPLLSAHLSSLLSPTTAHTPRS